MQAPGLLTQTSLDSRLTRAREAEHLGDYDLAVRMLGNYWMGVGRRPGLDDLDDELGAELLLRAGALTGYLGSAAQSAGAQEIALDLLTESHTAFTRLGLPERVAEVRIELATCYNRMGAFDAARAMLDSTAELLGEGDPYLRALAAMRRVITELSDGKYEAAVEFVAAAADLVGSCGSDALRGRYHNEGGALLFFLSEERGAGRYAEALAEFVAARHYFGRAGHLRHCASAENNAALTLVRLGRLRNAHRYVASARRLALCVDDRRVLSELDDTHSQLLAAQERLVEAEEVSRARLDEIAGTDHGALLAENLTTHAVLLAQLGRTGDAAEEFDRAVEVAESAGDLHGAARAAALRESELAPDNVVPFRRAATRGLLSFEWRVADESLRDIGIRRGDAVRFRVADWGRDGDLVAALAPGGRYVKLAYVEADGRVRLEGAHPRCPVRRVARSEISILGVARPHAD
jgi:tetratricopeptide (TPR) repeat protein